MKKILLLLFLITISSTMVFSFLEKSPQIPNFDEYLYESIVDEHGIRSYRYDFDGYIIELENDPLVVEFNRLKNTFSRDDISFKSVMSEDRDLPSNLLTQLNNHKETLTNSRNVVKQQIQETLQQEIDRGFVSVNSLGEIETKNEFSHVFNGFSINIPPHLVSEIENIPGIKKVHKNKRVKALLMDSVPLIQEGILAGQLDEQGNDCTVSGLPCLTGEGVTIAIIDTGVDYTHSDLGGCLGGGCKVIDGYDFHNYNDDPMDDHGHGTHCAATAAGNGALKGVAPEANILAYKVLGSTGSGSSDNVIAGIEQAVIDGADILSLSLGGGGNPDDPSSQAVDNAVLSGAVVIVAAGNDGPSEETIGSPGTARKAITVGSTTKLDLISWFSSRGLVVWVDENNDEQAILKPDIVAPGGTTGGFEYCNSETMFEDYICAAWLNNAHVAISGTSMATPHVAGAVALLKQKNTDWSPEEIKNSLKYTAIDLNLPPIFQGSGRINISAVIQLNEPKTYYDFFVLPLEKGHTYSWGSEELVEVRGIFPESYESLSVDYRKAGHENWESDGINIIGENNIVAEIDLSSLNLDGKGNYEFRVTMSIESMYYYNYFYIDLYEDVYINIGNCEELQSMGSFNEDYVFLNYELVQNIDCYETKYWNCDSDGMNCKGFEPVPIVNENTKIKSLNGQGFEISDLYINHREKASLFLSSFHYSDQDDDLEIKNVNLRNVDITSNNTAIVTVVPTGGFLDFMRGGIINNCSITGNFKGHRFVGGLVGYVSKGVIKNSYANVNISGKTFLGGITGISYEGNIIDVYTLVNIQGDSLMGGIAGSIGNDLDPSRKSTIINAYSEGQLFGYGRHIGGAVGNLFFNALINNTHTNNVVIQSSDEYSIIGGIVGSLTGGGIGKIHNSSATNCYLEGNIGVGGIAGLTHAGYPQIKNTFSENCTLVGDLVVGGGIGSFQDGSFIKESYAANNNIIGNNYLGGFVGEIAHNSEIQNSYASGNILRQSDSVGEYIGGFAGLNRNSKIINSYSTTKISYENTEDPIDKGFLGEAINNNNNYLMLNNFFDVNTSGQTTTSGEALGKTTKDMKNINTYEEWGIISSPDYLNEGYPFLLWESGSDAAVWAISSEELSYIENVGNSAITDFLIFSVQKLENGVIVEEEIIYENPKRIVGNDVFHITNLFNDLSYSCSEEGNFRLLVSFGGVEAYEDFVCVS